MEDKKLDRVNLIVIRCAKIFGILFLGIPAFFILFCLAMALSPIMGGVVIVAFGLILIAIIRDNY